MVLIFSDVLQASIICVKSAKKGLKLALSVDPLRFVGIHEETYKVLNSEAF